MMAAKYEIKLVCGHLKQAYVVASNKRSGYYCHECHKEVDRDMQVKPIRL